jgi:hyperosmotically inducible protein
MKVLIRSVCAIAVALTVVACDRTDTDVSASIKAKLAQDDLVKAHDINVTTRDHVVTLSGDVENLAAKQRAVQLARDTRGVDRVVDNLRVQTAATSGRHEGIRRDVERDVDHGVKKPRKAVREGADDSDNVIEEGAEAVGGAAKKTGKAIRDVFTDDDPDTDKDGK